jgi:peptidyl-dipeptidase A
LKGLQLEEQLKLFIKEYESKVVELSKETSLAYFNASISGKTEEYQRCSELQLELNKIYADKSDFAKLKKFKDSDSISDPTLKRQLDLIYNSYATNQFDENILEQIISLSTKVEEKFATYRPTVNDKQISDNEIDEILEKSIDQKELKNAWTASKMIGKEVSNDVITLVKLRNEAANQLGYKNYHRMSLSFSEQDPVEIENLFDELDNLTLNDFIQLKNEIDFFLAEKNKIDTEGLRPWHYEDKFFQQGPKIYKINFDSYFADKDIEHITKDYYKGIGLNIDDLLEKSDLCEKPGKYQHAYCSHIDKSGDVRVVCNIKPNHRWMATMLHEFGHAAYDKFIDMGLPWSLREPAHIFATEAIAMMFGRFPSNPEWLKDVIGISDEEADKISIASFKSLRVEQLVFSRWVQVMYRFEKSMYENPDQDLNSLWWNLVEKYQLIKNPEGRNEPDWASKIHIALYPAYYHNYMLGELLASQLYSYLTTNVSKNKNISFANQKKIGKFLIDNYFFFGSKINWKELIKHATGEDLSSKYYVAQFVN